MGRLSWKSATIFQNLSDSFFSVSFEAIGQREEWRSRLDKSPNNGSVADTNNHLVLLAESTTGYQNLVKLVSKGFLEGFYYRPRIDKEILAEHHEGIVRVAVGAVDKIVERDGVRQSQGIGEGVLKAVPLAEVGIPDLGRHPAAAAFAFGA